MLLISYPVCEEETTIIFCISSYAGEIAILHEINNCETPSGRPGMSEAVTSGKVAGTASFSMTSKPPSLHV